MSRPARPIACFAPIARPNEGTGEMDISFRRGPHMRDITRTLWFFSRKTSWVGRRILADYTLR
jgi:hypothetical protein